MTAGLAAGAIHILYNYFQIISELIWMKFKWLIEQLDLEANVCKHTTETN